MTTTNSYSDNLSDNTQVLIDELQLLLGASKITDYLENERQGQDGNLINYFKDSAYLHIRNLYQFLTKQKKGGYDDITLVQIGYTPVSIKDTLYDPEMLNRRVMHLTRNRHQNEVKEPLGTPQLNEKVNDLVSDITKHYASWANSIIDTADKLLALRILDTAQKQADTDFRNFKKTLEL
jgi:hypothetical protein